MFGVSNESQAYWRCMAQFVQVTLKRLLFSLQGFQTPGCVVESLLLFLLYLHLSEINKAVPISYI